MNTFTVVVIVAGCNRGNFKCDNGRCVYKNMICSGIDICGDGSNNKNCTGMSIRFLLRTLCLHDLPPLFLKLRFLARLGPPFVI